RLAQGQVDAGLADRDGLAVQLVRRSRVVIEDEAGADDLAARPGDRLADVPALERGQFLAVLLDQVGELRQASAALAGSPVRPALAVVEGLAGGLDRAIDVRSPAERGGRHDP